MATIERSAQRFLLLLVSGLLAGACAQNGSPGDDTDVAGDGADVDSGDSSSDVANDPPEDNDDDAADDAADEGSVDPDIVADVPDSIDAPDAETDAEPEPEPTYGTLAATATCENTAEICGTWVSDTATYASYRKDSYFLDEQYNEYTEYPLEGGRIHIAGMATRSGEVTDVLINSESRTDLLATPSPAIEWYHVWPNPVVAGAPVWVAFHSRDAAWDTAESGTIEVVTAEGAALDATFPIQQTSAPLTYVTTSDDRTRLLVHLRNDGETPVTLERLLVNGVDMFDTGVVCEAAATVAPARTAMFEVPLCAPLEFGAAWTVVAEYNNAAPAVGVGRVLRPFFPIEAWPSGGECPQPESERGANNFERHLEAGFDTMYYYWGGGGGDCGLTTPELVNTYLPTFEPPTYVLIGDDFLNFPDPHTLITDTSRVAGFLTGDESDGDIYLEDGTPAPENKARKARRLWSMYPELTVYNGGKTNGHVGTFAGMTDVQGMDLYVAACAPHITYDPQYPPLRGAYDYLRNTRENHMPLPTWLYAQGLHEGWNREVLGEVRRRQPNRAEVWVQSMSVIAAGGKGVMWFQSDLSEADAVPASWEAITQSNRIFAALRTVLREGDPTGHATSTGDVIVEAVRSGDAVVVPVINLAHTFAPTDLLCLEAVFDSSLIPEWQLAEQRVDVDVYVPEDLAMEGVIEIALDGTVRDAAYSANADTRSVRIHAVQLSHERPAAVYVLLGRDGLRAELEASLTP